jgi:hypothetical protein
VCGTRRPASDRGTARQRRACSVLRARTAPTRLISRPKQSPSPQSHPNRLVEVIHGVCDVLHGASPASGVANAFRIMLPDYADILRSNRSRRAGLCSYSPVNHATCASPMTGRPGGTKSPLAVNPGRVQGPRAHTGRHLQRDLATPKMLPACSRRIQGLIPAALPRLRLSGNLPDRIREQSRNDSQIRLCMGRRADRWSRGGKL